MKLSYLLILVFTIFFNKVRAQQTIDSGTGRAQNVFIEIGGQGILFTANYDTRFNNKRNGIGGRVGIGFGTVLLSSNNVITIPIGLNYLLGKRKNFFEIGFGATYLKSSYGNGHAVFGGSSDNQVVGTMAFFYRLQPIGNGFSFRIGLTPIFNKDNFIPYYGGLSLGYTFGK